MQDLLGTTLTLLAACSLAAVVTAKLRAPALLGYIVVGAVLGPSVAAWIVPGAALSFLSELGVALLLFLVGLEFSLSHFWLIRKTVPPSAIGVPYCTGGTSASPGFARRGCVLA